MGVEKAFAYFSKYLSAVEPGPTKCLLVLKSWEFLSTDHTILNSFTFFRNDFFFFKLFHRLGSVFLGFCTLSQNNITRKSRLKINDTSGSVYSQGFHELRGGDNLYKYNL